MFHTRQTRIAQLVQFAQAFALTAVSVFALLWMLTW